MFLGCTDIQWQVVPCLGSCVITLSLSELESVQSFTIHVITYRMRSVVNKAVGVEFNVIKVECILFFRMISIRTKI